MLDLQLFLFPQTAVRPFLYQIIKICVWCWLLLDLYSVLYIIICPLVLLSIYGFWLPLQSLQLFVFSFNSNTTQELLTLPNTCVQPQFLCGSCYIHNFCGPLFIYFSVLYQSLICQLIFEFQQLLNATRSVQCFVDNYLSLCSFSFLAIVLSVFCLFTSSGYLFSISKLFFVFLLNSNNTQELLTIPNICVQPQLLCGSSCIHSILWTIICLHQVSTASEYMINLFKFFLQN